MNTSRRSFLRLSALAGTAAAFGGCKSLFTGAAGDYDPCLTVLMSDVHVRGGESYQLDRFRSAVAEVLSMNPLPRNVVICGDLAFLYGRRVDYETSAPLLRQLSDAGIAVTIGMGNHDRRSAFFEVHPEYVARSRVPGRVVSVADIGHADLLMLDTLAGSDGRGASDQGPVPAAMCEAEQEWLAAELPKWKRPVLVCAHHPYAEIMVQGKPIMDLLGRSPAAGFIFGHIHRWGKGWQKQNRRRVVKWMSLPSTGHWGDIGYAILRTSPKGAEATLRQSDFFIPLPTKGRRPEIWDVILAENQGARCLFPFACGA